MAVLVIAVLAVAWGGAVASGSSAGAEAPQEVPVFFSDVAEDAWFARFVDDLAELSIVTGYPDGTFPGEHPVTPGTDGGPCRQDAQPHPGRDVGLSQPSTAVRW